MAVLLIIEAISLFLASLVSYRLFFASLARLPGPTICAITRLPLMYHEFSGNRRKYIHQLHLMYGPVVRVAPNEVSFATREAVKEIYTSGGSGYDKSTFYRLFSNFDTPNMFSTLDKGEHADARRRLAERYSKKHITSPDVTSVIQDHAEAFIGKIAESPRASVDIYNLLCCFALDGVSSHLFYPGGLHSLTNSKDYEIAEQISNVTVTSSLRRGYIEHYFPRLWKIYEAIKSAGNSERHPEDLASAYVLDIVSHDSPVASHTVLHKLRSALDLSSTDPDTHANGQKLNQNAVWKIAASECMDHLIAGIDTTGVALCFLIHHLSLPSPASQCIQALLHTELAQHPGAPVDALPYLDAVVKEGLRMFSPSPMSLPRVVPEGGRTLEGAFLPGGTIVSCQSYTLHRLDTGIFPDPDVFVPERWLAPDGATERNQLFFVFATGGRGCIGKHLALLEMKLLLREVYTTYRTRVAPDMVASMEQDDRIISSRPKDQKCLIMFEKCRNDL